MILAFDLDGVLVESKQKISVDMAAQLNRLDENYDLAIISGGMFGKVDDLVLKHINIKPHVFTHSGGTYYKYYDNNYQPVFWYEMRIHDRTTIETAMKQVAFDMQLQNLPQWGDRIEYRQSQITYSLLGQDAPLEAKLVVDADHKIKSEFVARLSDILAGEYEVRHSKTTSIDVSLNGINKSLAVNYLLNHDKVIYFGDAFDEHGNDFPVLSTSATCYSIDSPADMLYRLKRL